MTKFHLLTSMYSAISRIVGSSTGTLREQIEDGHNLNIKLYLINSRLITSKVVENTNWWSHSLFSLINGREFSLEKAIVIFAQAKR